MSFISPGSVPGVAGLGISFLPSPPLPSVPNDSRENDNKQFRRDGPDYTTSSRPKRNSIRHSISHESAMSSNYQLGGRRGAICEGMYQPESEIGRSINNFSLAKEGIDSRDDYRQGHNNSQLSPFSEESIGSSCSDSTNTYSPVQSGISPYTTEYNLNRNIYRQAILPPPPPRPQNRQIRHSQSMGILPSQKIEILPPTTVFRGLGFSTNNQPYPLSPTYLAQSPTSLSPTATPYSMRPLTPPSMPAAKVEIPVVNRSPSRLPAFLIDRQRREALARPKSMMELGQQYNLDAIADVEEEESQVDEDGNFQIENEDEYFTTNGVEVELKDYDQDQYDDAVSDFHVSTRQLLPVVISTNEDEPLLVHKPSLHRLFSSRSRSLSTGDAPPSPAELAQLRLYASMHNLRARLEQPRTVSILKNQVQKLEEQVEEDTASEQESPVILAPRAQNGNFISSNDLPSLSLVPRLPSTLVSNQLRPRSAISSRAPIQLEEQKEGKARIELGLSLDSSIVVEGGYLKGSIQVQTRKRSEREGDIWIGSPKIRIIGFEELAAQDSRNVFYHHATTLSDFVDSEEISLLTCFDKGIDADAEGYRVGLSGQHVIPFDILLPTGKGAKGSCKVKQGAIRYIVIASIKLKSQYGDERSIAHFHKQIDIAPYFDPSTTLVASAKPITSTAAKALFMGGSGKVTLTASIHRENWIAGQKCYVTVKIENHSSKKMKSLALSLIRSTTVMQPQSTTGSPGTPEIDRLTTRKKMAESTLQVCKKGSDLANVTETWYGVDAGSNIELCHFLELPCESLTITKGQYFEVSYILRVSVIGALSSEVTTDLPINIINFISIDPPPRHTGLSNSVNLVSTPTTPVDSGISQSQTQTLNAQQSHAMTRNSSVDSISLADLNSASITSRDIVPTFGLGARKRLNHQMSLDCISSVIASATARNAKGRSEFQSGSADTSLICSPLEESSQFYAASGSGSFQQSNLTHNQLDDLEEIPDDDDRQYYDSPRKVAIVDDLISLVDSETAFDEELEALMGSSTFGGSESSPFLPLSDTSIRPATPPHICKATISNHGSPNIVRSRPPSPLKTLMLPPPVPPKSLSKRGGTFAFATPSSPVKSTLPIPSPTRRNVSPTRNISPTRSASNTRSVPTSPLTRVPSRALPPPPLFAGHTFRRPSPSNRASTLDSPTNNTRIVKKDSSSSLKRTSALVTKKPSSRMLRDGQYVHSPSSANSSPPDLDSASDKSTPDMDHIRTPALNSPSLNQRPPFNSSPRKAFSPSLYSSRSVGDLRAPVPPPHRRSGILPSVLNKVAAMESRQAALLRLARLAVDGPSYEGGLVRTHSIAASEASFKLSDLERANSVESFKAPMLRR